MKKILSCLKRWLNNIKKWLGFWSFCVIIILFAVSLFIGIKKISSTYTVVTIESDAIPDESNVELILDGVSLSAQAQKGTAVFSIGEEQYGAQEIKFKINGQMTIEDGYIYVSSRNHVLLKQKLSDDICSRTDSGIETILVMKAPFISKYQKACADDWRLKLDILLPLWCVSVILIVFYQVLTKAPKIRKWFFIAVGVLFVVIIINRVVPNTRHEEKFGIQTQNVTDYISEDNIVSQSFMSKSNIVGISVKFGTYGNTPKAVYTADIIDGESGEVVCTSEIPGNNIQDTKDYTIWFDQVLKKNHKYIISFYAKGTGENEIVLWTSSSDAYSDGELFVNGNEIGADISFSLWVSGPNVKAMIVWVIFILVLVILLCFGEKVLKSAKWCIISIYALVLMLCASKMVFYYQNFSLGAYDEMAHISYLAYIEENNAFVPDFENMKLLVPYDYSIEDESRAYFLALYQTEGVFEGKFSNTTSYLGHPPLYYWLLSLINPVSIADGHVYVRLVPLRIFNMALILFAVCLFFYIGYSRIKKRPVLHLVYALLCTSVPMFCFSAATINNDNLTCLTLAVFLLGGLRFIEDKKNILTYCLIAIGISATLMTKLTAGVIVVLTALLYLAYDCIKEKSLKNILNKNMLYSLPIYIVAIAYYGILYLRFHSVQPSLSTLVSQEIFETYPIMYVAKELRERKEFWEFAKMFYQNFMAQWLNGVGWPVKEQQFIHKLPLILMWLVPIGGLTKIKSKKKENVFYGIFSFSILFTVLIQFIRAFKDFQFVSGHAGTQSRYYMCILVIMAFIVVKWLEKQFETPNKIIINYGKVNRKCCISWEQILTFLCIIYVIYLTYSSLLYYLLNTTVYPTRG